MDSADRYLFHLRSKVLDAVVPRQGTDLVGATVRSPGNSPLVRMFAGDLTIAPTEVFGTSGFSVPYSETQHEPLTFKARVVQFMATTS
jgi:hypothetical protein